MRLRKLVCLLLVFMAFAAAAQNHTPREFFLGASGNYLTAAKSNYFGSLGYPTEYVGKNERAGAGALFGFRYLFAYHPHYSFTVTAQLEYASEQFGLLKGSYGPPYSDIHDSVGVHDVTNDSGTVHLNMLSFQFPLSFRIYPATAVRFFITAGIAPNFGVWAYSHYKATETTFQITVDSGYIRNYNVSNIDTKYSMEGTDVRLMLGLGYEFKTGSKKIFFVEGTFARGLIRVTDPPAYRRNSFSIVFGMRI